MASQSSHSVGPSDAAEQPDNSSSSSSSSNSSSPQPSVPKSPLPRSTRFQSKRIAAKAKEVAPPEVSAPADAEDNGAEEDEITAVHAERPVRRPPRLVPTPEKGVTKSTTSSTRSRRGRSPSPATTRRAKSPRSKSPTRTTRSRSTQSPTPARPATRMSTRSQSPARRTTRKSPRSQARTGGAIANPGDLQAFANTNAVPTPPSRTRVRTAATSAVARPAQRANRRKRKAAATGQASAPPPPQRSHSGVNPPAPDEPEENNNGDNPDASTSRSKKRKVRRESITPNHSCPTAKVQTVSWGVPFLIALDHICEVETDFKKWYDSFFPTEASRTFQNRTDYYHAVDNALGKTINELQDHLGMEVQPGTTARQHARAFAKAKKDFERRWTNGLRVLRRIRKELGSQPSVYWYYSIQTICQLFTQYAGGPHTDAAQALYNDVYEQYIGDRYQARMEQADRFMYAAPNFALINGVENFKEHACRSFYDTPYEAGLKGTRSNNPAWLDNETPRTYYCRVGNRTSHEVYRQNIVEIAGYRVICGEDGQGLRDHPMSDLATDMLGYFTPFLRHSLMQIPNNMVAGLAMELDTSMSIADVTDQPAPDNVEDMENRIYGNRNGDEYLIKPWNNMAHHAAFFHQYNAIKGAVSGNINDTPQNEDIVEVFKLLRFHILVQDFRNVFTNELEVVDNVFRSRMRAYLTPS